MNRIIRKRCKYCKCSFVPKFGWQKFCSEDCRNRFYGRGNGRKIWSKEMFARQTVMIEG